MKCNVKKALKDAGAVNIKEEKKRYSFSLIGKISEWNFELEWSDPTVLPNFFLAQEHCTVHRPHVSWSRSICYTDGEGLSFDYSEPEKSLIASLNCAIDVLENQNSSEMSIFYDECEGYLNTVSQKHNCYVANCYFQLNDIPRKVKSYYRESDLSNRVFYDSMEQCWSIDIKTISKDRLKNRSSKKRKKQSPKYPTAIYLPLDNAPDPPLPGENWSIDNVKDIISQSSIDTVDLRKQLSKNKQHYIFSFPRSSGARGAFAVFINKANSPATQVNICRVARHNRQYLIERGGCACSAPMYADKVAIIGCGAVGGYISCLLSQSGYQNLTLVDNDYFSADNCYRHVLSKRYLNQKKTIALKKHLEDEFIDMSIAETQESATDWATDKNLRDHKIIFSATGSPTLERYLNELFYEHANHDQILVTTWLEPVGLGGHVVLSVKGSLGCINCLYMHLNEFSLRPQVSFVQPNQRISKNLTGCGGAFTPFSGLDAQQTALLAVRTLESHFHGTNLSRYDCWIGSSNYAQNERILTSEIYRSKLNGKDKYWDQKLKTGCRICRNLRPHVI